MTGVVFDTVEVHAEGEPGRVVLNADALVRGSTMAERLAYCRAHLDDLRRTLLHEPRGYPGLCGVLVLSPVTPGADFGIVVLEQGGFTPMSGSNTMCAVTAVLETGMLPLREPITEVAIDTAVGVVRAVARVSGGKVISVSVVNVPAFVVELDVPLDVPGVGVVPTDIVFGGQFFAQVAAADCAIELRPENGRQLARLGAAIKLAAREQVVVAHPDNPEIDRVDLVMLHSGPRRPGKQDRNTVVITNGPLRADDASTWTGALDRSPCGTGTSARMAALHSRGELAIGEEFRHHSIIGSEFKGVLTGTTLVGGRPAVLPTVTGRAWITGRAQWTVDETDLFPTGYTVGDIWSSQTA
ncbi:proline racemase family protein [Microbacterium hydrocarbonoxydans]|uniref:Proline racemase n=1 Tax=Microbacterium hydrocarbonoxydans TaxID=273678 RepID=A0A1H4L5I4_9MICO|nr:proline racemase family protein [Microbacterium hydrocarbonoxydans]SEB66010.1 proline racemase [Microbacterium hydrocarbonoxydans]